MMIIEKNKCVGCGACVNICSVQAIQMKLDEEGFFYPDFDDEKCLHCNACKNVCPVKKNKESYINSAIFYAIKSKSEIIRNNSASGGVFSEIAIIILSMGGYVWGASFNDNFNVEHCFIKNIDQLHLLCRSKYVQSITVDVFKTIKQQLRSGIPVLFSGTPCQTTAVANYVGKSLWKNLYLLDIICHGVPSPIVWQEYLTELCECKSESKEDIVEIYFKYKENDKNWMHPGFCVTWKDGKRYLEFSNHTWYEKGFLGNLYLRPSCHQCDFKALSSVSDLTLGDFWGCQELYPEMFDLKGVSLVAVKTKKGNYLIDELRQKCVYNMISKEEACKYNARINKASPKNWKRNLFWKKYHNTVKNMKKMEDIISHLTLMTLAERIYNKILNLKI